MKSKITALVLATAIMSPILLSGQTYKRVLTKDGSNYEGMWPKGYGVLYSYNDGLIFGDFLKGRPHGKCVCYEPDGEVYWGEFKKGKATGKGRIYRDNGIVLTGDYRNGRCHGIDTMYRNDGSVLVARYRKGKLVDKLHESKDIAGIGHEKPEYPRVDMGRKQEEFVKELELQWEERNAIIRHSSGFQNPRFMGGSVDDFAIWVNSHLEYPSVGRNRQNPRTVLVEFTVNADGTLSDVHAVFGSDVSLNKLAVETVKMSPLWEPGEYKGQKRNVRLTIPVVFD